MRATRSFDTSSSAIFTASPGLPGIVPRHELERPAEHPARRVDLLKGELDAHLVRDRVGGEALVAVDVADPDGIRGEGGGRGHRPFEDEDEAGEDDRPRDSGEHVSELLHRSSPFAWCVSAAAAVPATAVGRWVFC